MINRDFLCGRRDSNPYALRHQILSLAWLPITTRPQRSAKIEIKNLKNKTLSGPFPVLRTAPVIDAVRFYQFKTGAGCDG